MLRTLLAASMIATLAAGTAYAGQGSENGHAKSVGFVAGPIALAHTDEVQVGIVNVCAVDADYTVVLRNLADASDAATATGTVPANRGTVVTVAGPADTDIGALVVVSAGCVKLRKASAMVTAYLADNTTHLPRLVLPVSGR